MTQSIVRYFITAGLAYLVGHGVITQQIADANSSAITQAVIVLVGIAFMCIWSYLEKVSKGAIDKYFPPGKSSGSSSLPAVLLTALLASAVVGSSLSLIGCAGSTYVYTPSGSSTPVTLTGFAAWCENNLTTIRAASKSSVLILAKTFINQSTTAQRIASDIRAVESVVQPLLAQGAVSQTELENALAKVKVNDTDGVYAGVIEPTITLVGGYLTSLLNSNTPSKVISDVLTAMNNGLDDAAVSLDPTGA